MKYISILLILGALNAFTVNGQSPAQTIPDFTFFRLDQKPFTNKDLPKGKMLFFLFFDPECDHCQHAIQSIGKQYRSFKKASVYLVSMEGPDKINHFMDIFGRDLKDQKNVVMLHDKLLQFLPKFKPVKYPSMFLYSPGRKLLGYEDNEAMLSRFFKPMNG